MKILRDKCNLDLFIAAVHINAVGDLWSAQWMGRGRVPWKS